MLLSRVIIVLVLGLNERLATLNLIWSFIDLCLIKLSHTVIVSLSRRRTQAVFLLLLVLLTPLIEHLFKLGCSILCLLQSSV